MTNPTRMTGSMHTTCITTYHGGQTPGIRSTPMIAIGMITTRALTRSKARREPREADTVSRWISTATTGSRTARTHMNEFTV